MSGRLQYLRTIGRHEISGSRVVGAITRRVIHVPHLIAWCVTKRAEQARKRLQRFRDCHKGLTCVIIANGPSVRTMDLDRTRGVITFGMNRGYRLCETHGIELTYLVAVDVASQVRYIARDLVRAPVKARFANWNGRKHFAQAEDVDFLRLTFRPGFYGDVTARIYGGHSVTYACLQIAFFMGFRRVILVGKDHSYEQRGIPGQAVFATGSEDNHFAPGYYEPGQLWRIPDYKGEEMAYAMARRAFEADGREILDATIGGHLQVFPKVALDDVL